MIVMKSLYEAPIKAGVKVIIRCDLDVPIQDGIIKEEFRLKASLPTINYVIEKGGTPVICGHIGRPLGKFDKNLSTSILEPFFKQNLKGEYRLLENLRFNPGEEGEDWDFAKKLSQEGSIYVNESFATSHRKAASITILPKILPAYAGFRFIEEIKNIKKFLHNPPRPFVAIVGGAKVETKKPFIKKLADLADVVLVGGKLALEEEINISGVLCPYDYVDNKDIGPKTIKEWGDVILKAKSIVWAGPLGAFEESKYQNGTKEIINLIHEAVKNKAFALAGGGDTVSAINKFGAFDFFSFVSTGGGAMLDFIVNETLPGIEALN